MGASITYLLQRITAQRDSASRAKSIMKLTQKSASAPDVIAFLIGSLDSETPVVRFAAAGVLARALRDEAPDSAYDCLRQIAVDPQPTMPGYIELNAPLRQLVSEACIALSCFDRRKRETAELFASILDRRSDSRSVSIDVAHLLLEMYFKKRPGQSHWAAEELTSEQRNILNKLLSSRRPWTEQWHLARTLELFGLPQTKEELAEFLARSELTAGRRGGA